MEKTKSRKKWTRKRLLITAGVVAAATVLFLVIAQPFPLDPLPAYPNATPIALVKTSDLQYELTHDGDGAKFIEVNKNGLRCQAFVTTDTISNIDDFYRNAAQRAGLVQALGSPDTVGSLIFERGDFNDFFTSQNITGVKIFSANQVQTTEPIKNLTVDTKIIVLIQGYAASFYG